MTFEVIFAKSVQPYLIDSSTATDALHQAMQDFPGQTVLSVREVAVHVEPPLSPIDIFLRGE